MKKIKRLALASAIAATSTTGFTPIAFGAVAIEEVVVTARKREEVIQDVPVAITAVTSESLDRSVVTNFAEATRLTPGFTVPVSSTSPTALALSMRGSVQNDVIVTTDPSVGVYIDGIYIARSYGMGIDMVDLQDLQVLKGPQGTLFGRNSTAGALLLSTKNPEMGLFEGQVSATGGPDYEKLTGIVNVPLLDTLALRVALQQAERDDYIKNKALPAGVGAKTWDTELGGRESNTYRTKLRWTPTDALDLVLGYERFAIDDRTTGPQLWRAGSSVYHKPDTVSQNFDSHSATDTETWTFVGTYTADTWELKFMASDRDWQDMREIDYDGGDVANNSTTRRHGSWGREAGDQQSYELQLNTSLFDDAVDVVGGALYFKEFGQLYDYSYGFDPFVTPPTVVGGNYMENYVESQGYYTQATWHINEVSNLTVGLRYSKDDKNAKIYGESSSTYTTLQPTWDFNYYKNHLYQFSSTFIPTGLPVDVARPEDSFESVNWLVSYDYKITDDVMVYAKVSTGFRAGGFNGRGSKITNGVPEAPLIFDPEELTEYEVGFKGDFFDRRLRWNTAIYTNETEDKQLTTILNAVGNSAPGTAILNAGKAKSTGLETELTYLINDNFSISATYAYIDAKIKEKKTQAGVKLPHDELPIVQFVPENQFSLAVNYDQEFETFKLAGTASYAWVDEMYGTDKTAATAFIDAGGSLTQAEAKGFVDAVKTDAYGLLNLNLTASPLDDKYSVTLWVKNALDERKISSTIGFISGTTYQYVRGIYTEPRTWGATVTVNF